MTNRNRAFLAVTLVCLLAAGLGAYLYRIRRPLPAVSAGPAPNLLSELPSKAPVIAFVDFAALRKLQASPLAAVLGLAAPGPQEDRDYQAFVRDTGFNYTRDLDKAAIAFWPANLSPTSAQVADNRTLAVADGRFDRQKIEAYALRTGKRVTHGSQSFYEVPGNPPIAFEFLSPSRIAIASGKGAESLLHVPVSPAPDPALQNRISRVAGAPVFAVARTDDLPSSFYADFRKSPQLDSLAHSIQEITLAGQPDGNDIRTTLDAECDSVKNSFEIATLLDGFRVVGSMELGNPKSRGEMTPAQAAFLRTLLKQTKVTHQDRWVRLTLTITPAMLAPSAPHR